MTGLRIPCENGEAAGYACSNIDLLSKLAMSDFGATGTNDLWGWTDPQTGREYVLAGRSDAVAFVDVTDPINPVYMGELPSHNGERSTWRDIKVWRSFAFVVVDGSGANGMQVFDLKQLRGFATTPKSFGANARYDGVERVHNIAINEETGFAYLVGASRNSAQCPRGLHVVDIIRPTDPTFAGCFTDTATGRSQDGYIHDVQCVIYRGPDADYYGKEICFSSSVTHLGIIDVSDKQDMKRLAIADYPDVGYAHQGWLSDDHRYFFMNDEGDERTLRETIRGTRTLIWDVQDLEDPVVHSFYYSPVLTIDHNLYVLGHDVLMANYTSGLRIVDFSDIDHPVERGYFDTHPDNDQLSFWGAWSVYPYFKSGILVVNSYPEGLFVLKPSATASAAAAPADIPDAYRLSQAHPNPFSDQTTLTLTLPAAGLVHVQAYDVMGRRAGVLFSGELEAGTRTLHYHADALPSGVYLIVARAGSWVQTQPVTLVK